MLPRPVAAAPLAGEVGDATEAGLLTALLGTPVFVVFLLAVGAVMGSHAAFYTFGALHLKGQGISGTAFGALWGISIFAEIAVLAWSAPLIAMLGPVRLLMAACVAGIVRWGAMSLDPPLAVLVVLHYIPGRARDVIAARSERRSLDRIGGLRIAADASFHDGRRRV